jgi:hypothetical protein
MEIPMASPLRLTIAPAILFSALLSPAPALAEPDARAVALCRAEMLEQFPEATVRSHRVASISGNSRGTRVRILVNADRRYTFECTANAAGILTAAFDPPRDRQIATGQR